MIGKLFFGILCVVNSTLIFAQSGTINSITVLPANPTSKDTIRIVVDCTFPSGGCEALNLSTTQIGNAFNAVANHCIGPLTYICNKTDSFMILPQPQGNYKFIMNLYTGGAAPCNMNFADQDSVSFTVSIATAINHSTEKSSSLNVHYQNGKLHFMSFPEHFENGELRIVTLSGQAVFTASVENKKIIPLELSNGIYIISLQNQSGRITSRILVE